MFGNGATTGMVKIITATARNIILKDLLRALAAFFAVAVGTSMPVTAGWLIASGTTPITVSTVWASALPLVYNGSFISFRKFNL